MRLLPLGALLFAVFGCAREEARGRPWVRDLALRGVKQVDRKDLESKIAVEKRSWIPWSRKPYLDPFTLDVDKKRIEAYYAARGFFGARVVEAEAKPRDKESVEVEITVEEGAPTRIERIDLLGLDEVDAKTAKRARRLKIKKGQTFDHDKYKTEKDRILEELRRRGYAFTRIDGRVEVDRDAHSAVIVLQVTPGPRARFGDVAVDGAHAVDASRVVDYAAIRRGARFDPDILEEARGRVYTLGMFASVKLDYFQDEQDPTLANILISVREGRFHELRLGGGFGIESQRTDVHTSLIYTKRNFLGGLRTFRLRIEAGYVAIPGFWDVQRSGPAGIAEGSLLQPNLFWRTQLEASLGFEVGIDYAYQYYGPRARLGLRRGFWRERVQVGLSYNLQLLIFFNTDPAILAQPELAGRLYGFVSPYRLAWLQQDLSLDLRDRALDATKGGYFGLSAEEGGAWTGGAFSYYKLVPDVRGYLPLGSRVVLASRVMFGQIFSQGDLGSPITRRLYLGGASSHRGFNYNRLSPQIPSGIPGVQPLPIGGDQMLLAQLEFRLNMFKIAGSWLAMAAFLDGGDVAAPSCGNDGCEAVANVPQSIDIGNLHWATGGGLRYKTVVGTVRFDIGVRLNRLTPREPDGQPNPDPGERVTFHLSVGEAF